MRMMIDLSFAAGFAFAVAQSVLAAANWTGNNSGDLTANNNYQSDNNSWSVRFNVDNLAGSSNQWFWIDKDVTTFKLGGDSKAVYKALSFQNGHRWRFHTRDTVSGSCTFDNSAGSDSDNDKDRICIAAGYDGTSTVGDATLKMDDIKVKTKYLYVGGSDAAKAGKLLLIKDPDCAMDFTTTDNIYLQNGDIVSSNASVSCGGDLKIGVTNATASLAVAGGTFTVASDKWTRFEAGSTGTINLSGGTFTTQHIHDYTGGTSSRVVFNGGTLKANNQRNDGLIGSGVAVTVNADGGTIDNGGFNIFIKSALCGTGGMTFRGVGSVTLADGNAYEGVTAVELGTMLHIASTNGFVGGFAANIPDGMAAGSYRIVAIDGTDTFEGFALPDVPENWTVRLSDDKKSIIVESGQFWIGGASGSLNEPSNWSKNSVPGPGESCSIGNETAANLTNPEGSAFAPSSIVFPVYSAQVTINGNAITGIAAITNCSSVRHVFNCAVSGNEIEFRNTACCCEFWGGITLGAATFTGTASDAAKGLVGKWHFTGDWTPVSNNRIYGDSGNSSVTVAGKLINPDQMTIDPGVVVTAATMSVTTSEYFAYKNSGSLVVTGEIKTENSNADPHFKSSKLQIGTVEFGSFVNKTNGKWAYIDEKTVIVGEGGMDSKRSSVCFAEGPTLIPGAESYAINSTSGSEYKLDNCTLTINTTRRGTGSPATISVNGRLADRNDSCRGAVKVTGNGNVVFNKSSTFSNGLTVGGSATVAVKAGCTPGSGAVTVNSGATLEVAESAASGGSAAVTLGGDLTIKGGATLKFNFTERNEAPRLDATGKAVTLGDQRPIKVIF